MVTAIGDLLKWFNRERHLIEYDRLAERLAPTDPETIDPNPGVTLMGAVCKATGLSPSEWKTLTTLERLPWLRDAAGVDDQAVDDPAVDDPSSRLLAAMDTNELKICHIAEEKERPVKERMKLIVAIDERFKGKSSPEWSTFLDCSEQAVRKAWKECPELRYQKEEG